MMPGPSSSERSPVDLEISVALERLQADAIKRTGTVSQFLDTHKDNVLMVAAEKGACMTEELLGLQRGHLYSWARKRKITLPRKP